MNMKAIIRTCLVFGFLLLAGCTTDGLKALNDAVANPTYGPGLHPGTYVDPASVGPRRFLP